jgi:hypothetical protein
MVRTGDERVQESRRETKTKYIVNARNLQERFFKFFYSSLLRRMRPKIPPERLHCLWARLDEHLQISIRKSFTQSRVEDTPALYKQA